MLDNLLHTVLDRHLPFTVLWSETGCPVCMALQRTDCLRLSDLSTLGYLCIVCHTSGFYTHTIYVEVAHCWRSELITSSLEIETDAMTLSEFQHLHLLAA